MFAKEKLDYSAVQLPDRVEMNANDSVRAAEAHLEFMRKRHSVRDFVPTPVPQAVIDAAITGRGIGSIGCEPPALALCGDLKRGCETPNPSRG